MTSFRFRFFHFGIMVAVIPAIFYGYNLIWGDQGLFLIGDTSHGHHQIEMQCDACHTSPFGGEEVLQDACVDCHANELKVSRDSHAKSKFTDPRNAELLSVFDARQCAVCHREHRPEITGDMAVAMPSDFCFQCHAEIIEERESHANLAFDSCDSAGCHNYHDNTALYTDFLTDHMHEADTKKEARLPLRNQLEIYVKKNDIDQRSTKISSPDWLVNGDEVQQKIIEEWQSSAHSVVGVACLDCHTGEEVSDEKSAIHLSIAVCSDCHESQALGFRSGKHGMRIEQGLPPMTPAMAKLPMHEESKHKELSCVSCHGAHTVDTNYAAVDSCLGCHADEHTKAYQESAHYRLWQQEQAGDLPAGSGVSCASCHMPRSVDTKDENKLVSVEHNQNANLRPNEKMLRSVCMNCHGLTFSLNALTDKELIKWNFNAKPTGESETMQMVEDYLKKRE